MFTEVPPRHQRRDQAKQVRVQMWRALLEEGGAWAGVSGFRCFYVPRVKTRACKEVVTDQARARVSAPRQ